MKTIDPEEIPTADAVAYAIVAAARVTQDDPLLIADTPPLRCRFPALKALLDFYPQCTLAMLARTCGANTSPGVRLKQAEASTWWPTEGEPAYRAACQALEAA